MEEKKEEPEKKEVKKMEDEEDEEEDENEMKLTEEERKKKDDLDMYCGRIFETSNEGVQINALLKLKSEIQDSTSGVTSVPLALKLLSEYWEKLKEAYEKTTNSKNKNIFSDIMSVLSMTMGEDGDGLKYKLQGSVDDATSWGFEFIRFLAFEVGREFDIRLKKKSEESGRAEELRDDEIMDLLSITNQIVPYLMKTNHEPSAIDLLLEVDQLKRIMQHSSIKNYKRICRYLIELAQYHVYPENEEILECAYNIYSSEEIGNFPSAMRIAMMLHNQELIKQTYKKCTDKQMKRQLAFMLARHSVPIEEEEDMSDDEEESGEDDDEDDDDDDESESEEEILQRILNNELLSEHFLHLAKGLDALEPKEPKDIYKSHLQTRTVDNRNISSAKENLATSYVNGFVNSGFCKDKLMCEEKSTWIYHNKDHGKIGAVASLGLVYLWNSEEGMNHLDRFLYSSDVYVQAGALLGMGLCSTNVRNEADACFGVLRKYVKAKQKRENRICSILGLGIAYAGSFHEGVREELVEILEDCDREPIDIVCFAALSLGMVFVGGATDPENEDLVMTIMNVLQTRPRKVLESSLVSFLCLSLGFLYFGVQEKCESFLQMTVSLDKSVSKFVCMVVDACAYAGTGNVLKMQQFLNIVGEHLLAKKKKEKEEKDKKKKEKEEEEKRKKEKKNSEDESDLEKQVRKEKEEKEKKEGKEKEEESSEDDDVRYQAIAALGLGLVAMGEDIGTEMILRTFGHILHYGEVTVKKAIPLAMGLLHLSNPKLEVIDVLSRLSHERESEVAQSAILALGLVGCGTNNSRLATILRSLAEYYGKEASHLYMTRIAQGLLGMGKGLITISPFLSDRKILRPVGLCGLLITCFSGLDMGEILLNQYHYMLFALATSMNPRMLVTVDEELKPVPVSVRVGQAVDVVAKAGRAKTITGFQTNDTPVILQFNERAEMASLEKYVPCSEVLEDVIIVKKVDVNKVMKKEKEKEI